MDSSKDKNKFMAKRNDNIMAVFEPRDLRGSFDYNIFFISDVS